jgi:hypothetical protein
MFQIDYCKKVKKKTVNGSGFSLKVPKDFASRIEDDPQGQWGYGEFFQTNTFGEDYPPQNNVFFFYWKNSKDILSEKQVLELIETVCKEKVFSGEHLLEFDEMFPVAFKRFPAFILKYRFSHYEPKASGKASLFAINNTRQEKIFILGTVVESIGNRMIENETMAWIEDHVINSFHFKKDTS